MAGQFKQPGEVTILDGIMVKSTNRYYVSIDDLVAWSLTHGPASIDMKQLAKCFNDMRQRAFANNQKSAK